MGALTVAYARMATRGRNICQKIVIISLGLRVAVVFLTEQVRIAAEYVRHSDTRCHKRVREVCLERAKTENPSKTTRRARAMAATRRE